MKLKGGGHERGVRRGRGSGDRSWEDGFERTGWEGVLKGMWGLACNCAVCAMLCAMLCVDMCVLTVCLIIVSYLVESHREFVGGGVGRDAAGRLRDVAGGGGWWVVGVGGAVRGRWVGDDGKVSECCCHDGCIIMIWCVRIGEKKGGREDSMSVTCCDRRPR